MTANDPLTELKGVGQALANKFAVLGVNSIGDLLNYYPRRYEDYSEVTPINKLKPGMVTIEAEIKQAAGRYVRRGMHITEAIASDESGSLRLIWFNQPYRAAALSAGQKYYISGQYELRRQRFTILNPSVEMASSFPVNTARILSVYKETKGLTSRQIRLAVKAAFDEIDPPAESLPKWMLSEHSIISKAEAIRAVHQPISLEELEFARKRLGFEEVFGLSLASLLNKLDNQSEKSLKVAFKPSLAREFVQQLPFKLTDAQRRAVWQIYQDMEKDQPMNRLLEGDVGSGKTAVAAMAALMVLAEGMQVALMAPTELLARQHAETLHRLLKPLNMSNKVLLLVGSQTAAQKNKARAAIASGQAEFIIGTQALIQQSVDMKKLALIIVDEQHRFGVDQRKSLMAKAGHMPHVLSMTATPIPRSLALTLYGELDISLLDQKPAGRQPVVTEIIAPNARDRLYKEVDMRIEAGQQVFVVCPLITESDTLQANSAEKVYKLLIEQKFKHRKIGLLHGKQKAEDKQAVMQAFVDGKLNILVSTTVIEVGVDVPNATMMLIENPERFGLAQLHQLRGRVGRGQEAGHCYLLAADTGPISPRIRSLARSNDGFKLAELDLELRGPGAIYGTAQHGQLDLRIAKLTDTQLIMAARQAAGEFIDKQEDLLKYPEVASRVTYLRAVTNLN